MKICLIGGSGRSGTTILSKVFALHPQLVDVPEWRFLIDPDGIIDFFCSTDNWSPYHHNLRLIRLKKLLDNTSTSNLFEKLIRYIDQLLIKRLGNKFKFSPQYSGLSVEKYSPNFQQFVYELINNLSEFEYVGDWVGLPTGRVRNLSYSGVMDRKKLRSVLRKFLLNVMNDVIVQQDKTDYLEKNTWNILWFDKILELLPEAKLVHIYRDPRDVVTSFAQQTWMPSDVIQSAIIYRDLLNRWEYVKDRISPDSYIEISLDDLVEKPEDTTKKICRFWGLNWTESLLEIDLSQSNSGRWARELSPADISSIEEILNKPISRYGYS